MWKKKFFERWAEMSVMWRWKKCRWKMKGEMCGGKSESLRWYRFCRRLSLPQFRLRISGNCRRVWRGWAALFVGLASFSGVFVCRCLQWNEGGSTEKKNFLRRKLWGVVVVKFSVEVRTGAAWVKPPELRIRFQKCISYFSEFLGGWEEEFI